MNHKKITKLVTFFVVAMALILSVTVPAAAEAERLEYTGTNCITYMGPPERSWISDDGILHNRGSVLIQSNTAENDYSIGTMIMDGNIDLDLATGSGHTYGTFTVYPDAYNGTFVGHWSSHLSPDSLSGLAVGHGTGDLEGLQMFVELYGENPLINPCTNNNITILIP